MTRRIVTVKDVNDLIVEAAQAVRRAGLRPLSPSDLVLAGSVLRDYVILRGGSIDLDEALYVLSNLFNIKINLLNKFFINNKENIENIRQEIANYLKALELRPGSKVSIRDLAKRSSRREKRQIKNIIAILEATGVLKKRHGERRVASPSEIEMIAEKLGSQGFKDLLEAARSTAPKNRDSILLRAESRIGIDAEALKRTDEKTLLRIGRSALKKNDRKLLDAVTEELKERIRSGGKVRNPGEIAKLLEAAGVRDSHIWEGLIESGLTDRKAGSGIVRSAALNSGPEKGAEIVGKYTKLLSPEDAVRLAASLPLEYLWKARAPRQLDARERALFEAAVNAAKALREARLYSETLDPAHADAAYYYSSKARRLLETAADSIGGSLDKRSIALASRHAQQVVSWVESLTSSINGFVLRRALSALDYEPAIVLARNLYSKSGSEEERRIIISTLASLLHKFAEKSGIVPLPVKRKTTARRGRMLVRETIYRSIRFSQPPTVYEEKLKSGRLALVLDTSSSMFSYAEWALLVAGAFHNNISRLIAFNHDTVIVERAPSKNSLAELLLSLEFEGRTNISSALRAASGGPRRIVLVSDLYQTVKDEPVPTVVRDLLGRGYKLTIVVPPSYNRELSLTLESLGAKIVRATSPREAARRIARFIVG